MKKICLLVLASLVIIQTHAQDFVTEKKEAGAFTIASPADVSAIYVDANDFTLVKKAAEFLQGDIQQVTSKKPELLNTLPSAAKNIIIIGSIGSSPLIKRLSQEKRINIDGLNNKWEAFSLQTISNPLPGIAQALVITGSDRRGTAYGVFELSQKIGVSPWYWWADVPAKKKAAVYIKPGNYQYASPKIKYRGIFINDEAPAFSGWTKEKFGGVNHKAYQHVFELILRLKGNYIWPAMWGNAFYDDDSLNKKTADDYGIVIGTSHHEPLMRAHDEWRRYGSGKWDYDSNEVKLREFWKNGIKRMGNTETIISVGMRGDGDRPMTQGTATALLERIVKDQRDIIQEETGKKAEASPQLWALYKEVQDYYDKGMRVPDDITLLLCDDNWGNIRKLPKTTDKPRTGNYGIYYHFDYVGGPRNYKWLNTNPISRVWEQMHLAYKYGVTQIWIVNVGDIKPMEFPISFFLDYAWNPDGISATDIEKYTQQWAKEQFGSKHATAIANILAKYTKYNGRRKPELLAPDTYSLTNYKEAETIVNDYNQLTAEAKKIYNELPAEYKDAYYQLVLYPVEACAVVNELYVAAAKNKLYASQGRATTNDFAASVKTLFEKDSLLSLYYNTQLANGKWSHMMDQTRIGYTYWQQPPRNRMPAVQEIPLPPTAEMGVSIEGSEAWWPKETTAANLPGFDVYQQQGRYIDVFNRGQQSFEYTAASTAPYIKISSPKGTVQKEQRLWITIDWAKAPAGTHTVPVTISGANGKVTINTIVKKPAAPAREQVKGFIESDKYISIEATHFSKAISSPGINWQVIPDLGRTGSAVSPFPVTATEQTPGNNSPHLEYNIYVFDTATVNLAAHFSPTLNFHNTQGLRYAISIDDEAPQIINLHEGENNRVWEQWVANNIITKNSMHKITKPGAHVVKFWMVDAGIVLQKLVLDMGGVKQSYLGPPESYHR